MNWILNEAYNSLMNDGYDFIKNYEEYSIHYEIWNIMNKYGYLTEEEHINYRMNGISDTINNLFSNIDDSNVSRLVNDNEYYSGWYYDQDAMCCGKSKEPQKFAIYFVFYSKNDDRYAYVEQFKIDEDVSIKIHINLFYYINAISEQNNLKKSYYRAMISSSVQHELSHVFDSNVVKDRDISVSKKNSIYEDIIKSGNEFNLDIVDYEFIKGFSYYISPNERRAHLHGLSYYLEKSFKIPAFQTQYLYSAVEYKNEHRMRYLNTRAMVMCLLQMDNVMELSKLAEFRKMADDFDKGLKRFRGTVNDDKLSSRDRISVLGYYMFKHGMLDYKLVKGIKNRDVERYFKFENIADISSSMRYMDETMRELVKKSVYNIYLDYERRVYYECERQIKIYDDEELHAKIERNSIRSFVNLKRDELGLIEKMNR